jgi:phospholipid/cholesterol/gamma-HCH transport system permease protein
MLRALGQATIRRVQGFLYACGFVYQTLKASALFFRRRQVGYRVMTMQILFTGFEALGITAFISLALGAVLILQGQTILPRFGQGQLMYPILVMVITRELGPVLTAFIIIARSGTAIATQLGNMVISHEVEAYVSTGINPISFLVVPRVVGVTVSLFLLNLYFNFFGLAGSYALAVLLQPLSLSEYALNLMDNLRLVDVLASVSKSIVFGVIISLVATYHGFRVTNASTEIPQVVIKAVGQSFVFVILADAVITVISYV